MKLYLSSYRIPTPDELFNLIGGHPSKIRISLIVNAKDYYADRARGVKIRDTLNDLAVIGLKADVVDLKNYQNSRQVEQALSGFDAVFVAGGNTFCLMHEIKRSGFDEIIKTLLDKGLAYIGESAGAVIAGSSLMGVELADNPEFAESVIWEGLKLVDKIIWPHADNLQFAESTRAAKEMYKNNPKLVLLNDDQALVISKSEQKLISNS